MYKLCMAYTPYDHVLNIATVLTTEQLFLLTHIHVSGRATAFELQRQ